MKIAGRAAIFVVGVALLFFGWYKAHGAAINLQNPGTTNTIGGPEVLVVIGGFTALMAFLPSQEMLARWSSLKRRRRPQPAHFRRRRR